MHPLNPTSSRLETGHKGHARSKSPERPKILKMVSSLVFGRFHRVTPTTCLQFAENVAAKQRPFSRKWPPKNDQCIGYMTTQQPENKVLLLPEL